MASLFLSLYSVLMLEREGQFERKIDTKEWLYERNLESSPFLAVNEWIEPNERAQKDGNKSGLARVTR